LTSAIDNSNEITVTWENLTVKVPLKKDNPNAERVNGKPVRTIIENLTGVAKSNEIIGLLGPSGSGKTVLLNILSSYLHLSSESVYERNVHVNNK
jgi:ABC-type multidrug transport system ATPase subunit